ncbi:hypothetical protein Tco_1311079 [Tanacetum coccineum]
MVYLRRVNFRRWQKKLHFLLSSMSVVYVLTTPIPEDGENATIRSGRFSGPAITGLCAWPRGARAGTTSTRVYEVVKSPEACHWKEHETTSLTVPSDFIEPVCNTLNGLEYYEDDSFTNLEHEYPAIVFDDTSNATLSWINWDKPPKDGDGAWHAKIRIIDPDGQEFTKTLQSIPATRKLSIPCPKERQKPYAKSKSKVCSTPVSTTSTNNSTPCLSDATVYAYLATQPNGSQVVHEDLEQIHEDDLVRTWVDGIFRFIGISEP